MTSFAAIVLCVLAVVLLLPLSLFLLQVLMALPAYRVRAIPAGKRPGVAVVVPAHNEASLIANAVRSIATQLVAGDRLLVVADNCSDDTAEIAAAAGAEVIRRCDPQRRGKGYALDFAVRNLEEDPREVLVVVDADCYVQAGAIDRLARVCLESNRPVQGLYLMQLHQDASLSARMAQFAWVVKNKVRALGNHRLGWPCPLLGSGMAIPWPTMQAAAPMRGHLVEDLKLGIELTRAGAPPLLCPEALVTSSFPARAQELAVQRRRWEHGHLGLILSDGRLALEALARGNTSLLALMLNICVPPLALLTLLVSATLAASAALWIIGDTALPFLLTSVAAGVLGLGVLLAWLQHGRELLTLNELLFGLVYAVRKIPLYAKFLFKREANWVGSRRIS